MWSEMGKQNIQAKKVYISYNHVQTKIMKPRCVFKNLQFIFNPQGGRQVWLSRVQLNEYIHTLMHVPSKLKFKLDL